ncbi:hypothetical protein G6F68_015687 [Rhizopus microsporus]|nr:hypothetical protein G6F68_015687 [Rhizopus microsporus]
MDKGLGGLAAEAFQHVRHIDPHVGHGIAAFHREDRGQPKAGQMAAPLQVVGAFQLELGDGVAFVGVHTQRDHNRVGLDRQDGGDALFQRVGPRGKTGARGQRQVQVGACARACPMFIGIAQEERVFGGRVAMHRDRQHVAAFIEDALRAIAVVACAASAAVFRKQ